MQRNLNRTFIFLLQNSMPNQGRRNPNAKYRKDNAKGNAPNVRHHSSGYSPNSSNAPMNKNAAKHYQNAGYEDTAHQDGGGKMQQYFDPNSQPKYGPQASVNRRDGGYMAPESHGYYPYVQPCVSYPPVEPNEHVPVYMPLSVCPPVTPMMQPLRGPQMMGEDSPDMYNAGYSNQMMYGSPGLFYTQAVSANNLAPPPQSSLNSSGISSSSSMANAHPPANPQQ